MKLTKYAQSCFLIETKNKRILIDPSYFKYDEFLLEHDWKNIDILLITHKHKDHFHKDAIRTILDNENTQLFTSKEVSKEYSEFKANIVEEDDVINCELFKIKVVKAIHGFIPTMKGKQVKEGLGFIIFDGQKKIYHTGDTICFENDYKADVVLAPVSGRGLVMGPYEAALFTKECGAELLIPCHMDNPKYVVHPDFLKKVFEEENVNYKLLKNGESLKI
ncbi:hypothetical protein COV11_02220 [Candidatus Woesearchaeota archaeon CG10_big_fil_rev_8_21_14_0_10_30_7]|nr:MAG: hypothetical protein COV11_02220 [Candidatus Woesearchaeota archaeon CG10_big_fil_rev_8_21_14_0_10_30_7]